MDAPERMDEQMAKATTAQKPDAAKKKGDSGKAIKAKSKVPAKAKAGQSSPNVFARIVNYFSDVRTEMRRVVWPTRDEVFNSSVVVVVTLFFFVFFTLVVDQIVIQILSLINRIGG